MPRAAAFALFLSCLACARPPDRTAEITFRETRDGMRLSIEGVEVGAQVAHAAAALGGAEAVLRGPGDTTVTVRWDERAGRVGALRASFEGSPMSLQDARIAISTEARRAGATCGWSGCAVRDAGASSAVVKVTTVQAWPTSLELEDAPPPEPAPELPRLASAR